MIAPPRLAPAWWVDTRRSLELLVSFYGARNDPDGFYRFQAADCVRQLSQFVPLEGTVVLDVGGGPGHAQVALAAARARYVVVDHDLAEIGARSPSDAPCVLADGMRLPIATASVDVCLSSNVLEHVAEPEALAVEMLRVTRPGGVLYLSYTNWLSPHGGHETRAHLVLGGRRSAERYARRNGRRPKNDFGVSLFPCSAARMLAWAAAQAQAGRADVLARLPRYHPRWARWVIEVPGLRELACWNVLIVLRRR